MERQDVRLGIWVFTDHNYNIIKEGPFEDVSSFSKNAPNGIFMSKKLYEQTIREKGDE
jgi:hypothetical protein